MTWRDLTLLERDCCYLARRLNRNPQPPTVRKIERQAGAHLAFVNALRPLIEQFDKGNCMARGDMLACDYLAAQNNI